MTSPTLPRFQAPLHLHISTLFALLILLVGGSIGIVGYRLSLGILDDTAQILAERSTRETQVELQRLIEPAEMAMALTAQDGLPTAHSLPERLKLLPFLREALNRSPALASIYAGYEDGDFFFLRRLRSPDEEQLFQAPAGTTFIAQSIERQGTQARGRYIYLDADLRTLREDDRPDYAASYDPRSRTWFTKARDSREAIKTDPYVFFSNRRVGMTLASRTSDGRQVVGADILLTTLGATLSRQKLTPGSITVLLDHQGQIIAHEDIQRLQGFAAQGDKPRLPQLDEFGSPVLTSLTAPLLAGQQQGSVQANGQGWRFHSEELQLHGAQAIRLLVVIPEDELFAAALKLRRTALLITLLVFALALPVVWMLAHGIARPLRALMRDAEAVRKFDFSSSARVHSVVTEVDQLADTVGKMKSTIRRFLDINLAVASERDFDRLLPRLLAETLKAVQAEGGVLYLADGDQLYPAALHAGQGHPQASELLLELRSLPLLPPIGQPQSLLGDAVCKHQIRAGQLSPNTVEALGLAPLLARVLPDRAAEALAVPLCNREGEVVGAILLLLDQPCEEGRQAFVQALSGSAAITLETRELVQAQRELFESFIQMLAGAIDAKSPYTGGHCARVPELTKMIAEAACRDADGPFRHFQLTPADWESVHVASWLHDCGKITTPEYVVDKATKLETIYDRIHEVRMRFEVLKRDAEIACLQAILAGTPAATAEAERDRLYAELDAEFAFVAQCNEGGEFMAPDKIERLRQIAQRTWQRTLSDRLGISHEEKERKEREAPAPLPATEFLLADKAEHRFERSAKESAEAHAQSGFQMEVPELLYNRGEVYNLSVGRGTLTEEERFKINEHSAHSIIMLKQLPFPKHLRNVPEIAGGHHEKMDGTGYPRRLTREEMSPLARMMTIADIFEALTATDRPYKKGKTLSEAIHIMSFMKKDQHIDPELFELFLRSGVYRHYGEKFLRPEQIDDVDIHRYLPVPA